MFHKKRLNISNTFFFKLGSAGQLVRFGNTAPSQITQTHDFQNCMINNYFPILLASLAYKNLARLFRLECQVAFHLDATFFT